MPISVTSKNKEKTFTEKNIIIIGSTPDCDFIVNTGFNFILKVNLDEKSGKYTISNEVENNKILFRGIPFTGKIVIEKFCKLKIDNSEEFISIKILENTPSSSTTSPCTGNLSNTNTNPDKNEISQKLANDKEKIEKIRIAITKQISFAITDLKKRISLNLTSAIFFNTALVLSTIVMAFGITNYIMGLPISDTVAFMTLPTNIKMLALFSVLIYAITLVFKQGVFILLKSKNASPKDRNPVFTGNFMIIVSSIFYCGFYTANLIYYSSPAGKFIYGTLISLALVLTNMAISFACGYFKFITQKLSLELNKYEYREDFELILNRYQNWIEIFINNLSSVKLNYIKDRLFTCEIKKWLKILLGLFTAPVLAFGVSNTLAMCFPEAAGWVRISNVRFSPVFLVLSSLLIVFAFFTISSAFFNIRKINGSEVIKLDGFRNYLTHGVDIFGLQTVRTLNSERIKLLVIGFAIIFIEFTMNTSFFMSEIGADLSGIIMSFIAAAVPTALLLAETYLLSCTYYEIFVCDSIISKLDE